MKTRSILILLAICLALNLCACGRGESAPAPKGGTEPGYLTEEIGYPDWLREGQRMHWDSCCDSLWVTGETPDGAPVLASYDTRRDQWRRYDLDTAGARDPFCGGLSVAEGTFWLLLSAEGENDLLWGDADTGETRRTPIPLTGDGNSETGSLGFSGLLALSADRALLTTSERAYWIDPTLQLVEQTELPGFDGLWWFRVDGVPYLPTPEGFAPLNAESLTFAEPLALESSRVYASNAGHILCDWQGELCELSPETGELTPRFAWMDVALSYDGMGSYFGLENADGAFFYPGRGAIVKVTPGMVPVKETLTLACFGEGGGDSYLCTAALRDAILRFNHTDPAYKIEIRPFLYDSDSQRDRLLIELATAEDIDLIDTSFLPDSALRPGLLTDMLPLLDADETMGREDFVPSLLAVMTRRGGLYEYTDKFTLLTLLAGPALSPGREEWTLEEMERLMGQNPDLRPLWYGGDPELLLTAFSWAATGEFIDWDTMDCHFDSPAFQNWLPLLKELTESREGEENLLALSCDLASDADGLARCLLPGGYAIAGFPEARDGGSYFLRLGSSAADGRGTVGQNTRLGILAASKHPEGAWRFVRALMRSGGEEDQAIDFGIPVLKERLEQTLRSTLALRQGDDPDPCALTPQDAEQLRETIYATTRLACTDEELITLLRTALKPYLAGQKSAEETALQLQSRVSLYLAEQT